MTSKRPSHKRRQLHHGGVCLAIWVFLAGTAGAQPVILYLRGGDRVSGTITAEDTNRVVLATPWTKEMIIPTAEILKRYLLPAGPEIKAPEAKPSPAGLAAVTATNTAAAPALALVQGAPRPGTAAVSGPLPAAKPKGPRHWSGEAQVGLDLALSERKRQLYSGRFKVTYVYDHFRNLFDYSFAYGKTDGLVSDDRMYGSSKTDFELGKKLYVYSLGGAGFDEIQKIDLRYELGPGFGLHLVKLTNFVLNTEAGANYQAQYRSDNTTSELFFFRLAESTAWTINNRTSIDERFEFFPQFDAWGRYRFRFESNARYALLNNLAFVVSVLDQYDTQPALGVAHNDLQLRSSISLKF